MVHGRPRPRKTFTELEPVIFVIDASAVGSFCAADFEANVSGSDVPSATTVIAAHLHMDKDKQINRPHTHTHRERTYPFPRHRHKHTCDKNNTPNPQTKVMNVYIYRTIPMAYIRAFVLGGRLRMNVSGSDVPSATTVISASAHKHR